ncbi:tRNA (guanine-N7)-methyltransferase [Gammaproteobacteria bacterium]|nr:tRNA (guanine-N7)-methyltransferase [Gammaproteobacteria bacterium]MDA7811792.1 tRNA (guanine-N7)-methyltransferase [Gammaproteobacteria bacterium]MDA7818967.1 tRNA (guanine-N7)-methyltransferase [Gammaproteobacteria bacterium]MDA8864844.1 tRNA (guanine-N7)-methyltransferase [Gammaproteobacteria bacterium]MDA8997976.1 tRNA (guanine-N7)-methyltransferase [Gammaproteobacteria bacterium]|tara:strand:- start:3563 stop:4210 length:648 start_codon:yes stop_codon:yes gene_type:complete
MRHKYLPSFVKRRGRITKSQEDNLSHLSSYEISSYLQILQAKKKFSKVVLEVGFGNGENTLALAKQNPDTLYIASEVYLAGIGSLLGEIVDGAIQNIFITSGDIRLLIDDIKEPVFDDVIVICPDPWPKFKHHKRRMLTNEFFELIHPTIQDGGELFMSTDVEDYAESITEQLDVSVGFQRNDSSLYEASSLTKFQRRAMDEGRKIYPFSLKKIS